MIKNWARDQQSIKKRVLNSYKSATLGNISPMVSTYLSTSYLYI